MRTWIEISRANLLHNLGEFQRLVKPRTVIMAVVKANAYGHGVREVVLALKSQKNLWFAVDKREEGSELRGLGVTRPILVMGYVPPDELASAVKDHLDLTIYNRETVRKLRAIGKPARVHLKLETGTNRQGVGEVQARAFSDEISRSCKNVSIVGISTHYANQEIEQKADRTYTQGQLKSFNDIVRRLRSSLGDDEALLRHTAATAGAILYPKTHLDAVRVGIGLYGYWPSRETMIAVQEAGKSRIDLRPVLSWKTRVAQIKYVARGAPISYGLTERVSRPSRIAVIPIGYYDGYDRGLSSIGSVLVRGERAKVMGRVCMNMMMVDVTDIPRARLEDEAVILGRSGRETITADEIAEKIHTIAYEILARINPTLPRVLV